MKLKDGFVTHTSGGEHILLSTNPQFNGLVRSNGTAAFIIEQMKEQTTVEKIVDALLAEYQVDRETAQKGVETVVARLRAIGALEA